MYSVEPELLNLPPRRVYILPDSKKGVGCLSLCLLPFVVVGLGVFLYVLIMSLSLWLGSKTPGSVVGREEMSGGEGDYSYQVTYRYRLNDHWYIGEDNVRPIRYEALTEGSPVTVKYFFLYPGNHTVLDGESALEENIGFLWLWVGIWNVFFGGIITLIVRAGYRQRRLVQYGSTTAATITNKTVTSTSETKSHHLHYTFRPITRDLAQGELIMDSKSVSETEWNAIRKGDTLTVLYLRDSPNQHDLYACGLYRAL